MISNKKLLENWERYLASFLDINAQVFYEIENVKGYLQALI